MRAVCVVARKSGDQGEADSALAVRGDEAESIPKSSGAAGICEKKSCRSLRPRIVRYLPVSFLTRCRTRDATIEMRIIDVMGAKMRVWPLE